VIVRLQNIVKQYPSAAKPVLSGINLEIESGEFISIIGESGAGKTTLLNILGCVDRPSSGVYHLDNFQTEILSERSLATVRADTIGFVFQNYHLIDYLSVRQNLEIRFLYNDRISLDDCRHRVEESLEDLGIAELSERYPRKLSGGEMQRVALARALVGSPKLLLADEPTGNLDRKNSENVFEILKQAAGNGTAVVMVSHDEVLARRCPRCYRIREGRFSDDS